jgi:hypothetical protein
MIVMGTALVRIPLAMYLRLVLRIRMRVKAHFLRFLFIVVVIFMLCTTAVGITTGSVGYVVVDVAASCTLCVSMRTASQSPVICRFDGIGMSSDLCYSLQNHRECFHDQFVHS